LFRGTKEREVSVIPYALYRFPYSSEIPRKWNRDLEIDIAVFTEVSPD